MLSLKQVYSGRIGGNYFIGLIFLGIIFGIAMALLTIIMAIASVPLMIAEVTILIIAILANILFVFPLGVRRLHDLGKEAWIIYPFFAAGILSALSNSFYPSEWVS